MKKNKKIKDVREDKIFVKDFIRNRMIEYTKWVESTKNNCINFNLPKAEEQSEA